MRTFIFLLLVTYTVGVYVFKGDPYVNGPLSVKHVVITKAIDGSPEHMSVYFPVQSGDYVPLIFISGLYGFLLSEMYSDVLVQLASHGYVVVGIDLAYPAGKLSMNQQLLTEEPQRIYKVIDWLQANLNQDVFAVSGNGNVKANWTHLGAFSHSAGGDSVYRAIAGNETLIKAVTFLEPMSFLNSPLNYSIPSLSLGTQLSEEFPDCILPKYDYQHFYNMVKCPRIKMNITMHGHCDILNENFWEACHLSHFCKTDPNNDRVFYRTFIAGVLSSMFGYYLQHNQDILEYASERNKIPMSLGNLQIDLNCMHN